ncbi:MAG TPA: Hsp70 family protein [Pseudonocardia sp.]|nr:Hsp70 family protein [Pseudonocardia sp.]
MTHLAYRVGIDLGTTYSAAAVCRAGDPRPEVVPLGGRTPSVASMVFLAPDGSMVCGEPAQRRAVTDPRRVVREFKRRLGDGTPLVVGGQPVAAEAVAARFVAWMIAVVGDHEGGPAERVALTHPAEWGSHKRDALAAALAEHGVTDVQFLSEPEAAAIGYANTARVDTGGTVAVYDLGGGTFDAAVVRKLPDGAFELVGAPVGIEHLGGVDFDQAVFDHVRDAVGETWDQLDPADPAVQSAVAGLRRECTAAKEALSADTEVMIPVMLPGHHLQVRLGRAEFEEAIRPSVVETVEALRRALASAEVPEPDAVLMVGGSSRIPLVAQLVSAELGRSVAIDADPESVIATGAAVAARGTVPEDAGTTVLRAVPVSAPGAFPAAPPLENEPGPGGQAGKAGRPRRGPVLALVTAAAVAAAFAVGAATLANRDGPLFAGTPSAVAAPGGDGSAPPVPVDADEVDPWTGETATATSLPGPQRPRAVAAATRPVARIIPTGAVGASAAAGPTRTVDAAPPPGATVTGPPAPGTRAPAPGPGAPAPRPEPGPGPAPGPGPSPDSAPRPGADPVPGPGPGPGPGPAPTPNPGPGPGPGPVPDPGPTPVPGPDPIPDPGPGPVPDPDPGPDPVPDPVPPPADTATSAAPAPELTRTPADPQPEPGLAAS